MERGLLPSIYFSDDPAADLESYAGSYLQEEIVAGGATRNVPAFSRFLRVAALCNGTIVNFTKVGNDAQVARTTAYEYFAILKDTLILHELPAWRQSRKRKPIASSKYYSFDVGLVGTLQGRRFRAGTPEYGQAIETYVMHELTSHRDYVSGEPLSYWRSMSGFEVDRSGLSPRRRSSAATSACVSSLGPGRWRESRSCRSSGSSPRCGAGTTAADHSASLSSFLPLSRSPQRRAAAPRGLVSSVTLPSCRAVTSVFTQRPRM